jgi:Pyridoxamine 5'-phosphate oxidase
MTDSSWNDKHLQAALAGNSAARFLATCDAAGLPHVVPALSAQLAPGERVRFAAVLPEATEHNLTAGAACALLVIDEKMRWWSLGLRFVGFTAGEPGAPVQRWGELAFERLLAQGKIGSLRLTGEFTLIRAFGIAGGEDYADTLPGDIARRLGTLKAVKAMSFVDADGAPVALPCPTLTPAGPGAMVFGVKAVPQLASLVAGTDVAVCLLTFAPAAYQIFGRFEGVGGGLLPGTATIRVRGVRPALV